MKTVFTVSIYIDTKTNMLIIPSAKNEHGIRMGVNYPQKLVWEGGNYSELGEKFIEAYQVSSTHPPIKRADAVKVFAVATGVKSWVQFAKQRQMICVSMVKEDSIFEIEFWKRQADNSFGNDVGDVFPKRELPADATAEEIGRAIIDVYKEAGVL